MYAPLSVTPPTLALPAVPPAPLLERQRSHERPVARPNASHLLVALVVGAVLVFALVVAL